MNIFTLYEKVEKLTGKLPAQLQHPILREIGPLKSLFLQQRAPRVLLLGDREESRSGLINALFQGAVAAPSEDLVQTGAWQLFASPAGKLRVLDARRPVAASAIRRALAAEPPDICLFLHGGRDDQEDLQRAQEVFQNAAPVPVYGIAGGVAEGSAETARHAIHATLERGEANPLAKHVAGVFVPVLGQAEIHQLAAAIAAGLPDVAKLEMARLSGVRELQHDVARALVKSTAAICGAIGAQPIPLADFPILTALQAFMVAGVMYISGREMSKKLGAEFLAAIGANIGMGLVLREGSRAVLKLVPIWGDIVAGGIAAAGTYAVGKAASAYFIDGVSLDHAQQLFRERKKGQKGRKQLP